MPAATLPAPAMTVLQRWPVSKRSTAPRADTKTHLCYACSCDSSRRCYLDGAHLDTPRLSPLVGPSQHCHYQPTLEGKTELCVKARQLIVLSLYRCKNGVSPRVMICRTSA